jgi:SAM-dependent methyltransferase
MTALTEQTTVLIDEAKVEAFAGQVLGDLGAAFSVLLARVGDRLGLWAALAERGPCTSEELAEATGTHPRMIREWLSTHAAGGYVTYDPTTTRFTLPAEHALVLARDDNPASMCGGLQTTTASYLAFDRLAEVMRSGKGLAWGDHHSDVFEGTERFFKPAYTASLTSEWIPALTGIDARLRDGGSVADVGCGHGASTLLIAEAFPAARVVGYDLHEPSIRTARERARATSSTATFEVASAQTLPDGAHDLICLLDCLHDMDDPVGAARRAGEVLAPDGSLLLVEPAAGDRLEDNLHPLGRLFYAASTVACTPNSLDGDGPGLGAQAGPERLTAVLHEAGFTSVRQVSATPINHIYEARLR